MRPNRAPTILLAVLSITAGCGGADEPAAPPTGSNQGAPGPGPGDPDRELLLLRRVAAEPDDLDARLQLAHLYYDTDRRELAIPHYRRLLDSRPDDAAVRTDLGTCYTTLAQWEAARAEYERVLRAQPEHVQAMFNLGVVALAEGNHRQAIELWDRVAATTADPAIAEKAREHAAQARVEAASTTTTVGK